ncbi:MAG: M23 family metallopeptidase [Eubacteriales bacterium]|nr:M23 family metallopeptidase [Eubacteriales bacterium]
MKRYMCICIAVALFLSISVFSTPAQAAPYEIHTEVYNDWYVKKIGHRTITVIREYFDLGRFLYSTTTTSYSGSSDYEAKPYYTDGNTITFRYDSGVSQASLGEDKQNNLTGYTLIGVDPAPGKSIYKHVSLTDMSALVSKHPYRAHLWNNIYITSPYGPRSSGFHKGIDYGTRLNTYDITTSTKTARVKFYNDPDGYGLYANVEMTYLGTPYKFRYAHMSLQELSLHGKVVNVNTIIGKTGTTGNSTGIHLHLEVWKNDNHTDPEQVFHNFHVWGEM